MPYQIIQESLGMTVDAYGNMSAITNEFTRGELETFKDMHKEFLDGKDGMINYFETDAEYLKQMHDLQADMINQNYRALESFDKSERKKAALYQKNLNLSSETMTTLLNKTYAYSGETSTKILDDIVAHSKHVGDAVGISFKDLADETAKIVADTERFGNISADTAVRIAATYKQLGLDFQTFGRIIDGYRDFD